MLLIERANIDILILGLLVMAISLRDRPYGWYATLLFASILKLYPLFAAVVGIKKELKKNVPLLLFVVALGLYLIFTWQDLVLISKATPRSNWFSYGMNVFLGDMSARLPAPYVFLVGKVLPVLLVIGISIIALFRAVRDNTNLKDLAEEKYGFGFLIGASVYCGTFVIGNNYDYRLSLLILTIPQLYDWAKREKGFGFHSIVLACVLFMLWNNAFINYSRMIGLKKPMFLLEETISWLLFYFFSYKSAQWSVSAFSLRSYFAKRVSASS
jgi:hypothetical protein